jgi:hypothetical protein
VEVRQVPHHFISVASAANYKLYGRNQNFLFALQSAYPMRRKLRRATNPMSVLQPTVVDSANLKIRIVTNRNASFAKRADSEH